MEAIFKQLYGILEAIKTHKQYPMYSLLAKLSNIRQMD